MADRLWWWIGLVACAGSALAQSLPQVDSQAQSPGIMGGLGRIFGAPVGVADPRRVALETQQILQTVRELEMAQRYAEAMEECDKGLASARQSPMAGLNQLVFGNSGQQLNNAKIRLLVKSQQYDRAVTLFRQNVDALSGSLIKGQSVSASIAFSTLDELILSLALVGRLEMAEEAIAYYIGRFGPAIDGDPILVQRLYRRRGDVAYQLGQREMALAHYQRAWKGAQDVARVENGGNVRSGGFAAIQAIMGELPNTSTSLLSGLYDDFDIDTTQLPYAANGMARAASQSMPVTILRDLVATALELGRTGIVVDLYLNDLPAFMAVQEKSAAELVRNRPPSSLPTGMTTASQGVAALFLAFGEALEAAGQPKLALDAYQQALKRSQAGLEEISTGFGSPRAGKRLYVSAIASLGRWVNLAGGKAGIEERANLAQELGLLKGSIHDRLLLANRMPYEIGQADTRELQRSMQASYERVVSAWNESRTLDNANFAKYAEKKIELTKRGGEWLRSAVTRQFDRPALDRALASLPAGTAVIDYFLAEGASGKANYWAFIHRPGKPPVQMIKLGSAEEIDKWVVQLRQDILDVNEPRIEATANKLGGLLWAPVASLLVDVQGVTVSPDGQLLLLPFDVLRYKDKYLLEQTPIRMVNSLRDLIPFRPDQAIQTGPSVLVGDPDFGLPSAEARKQRALFFEQLPGTRKEVMQIAQRMKSFGQAASVLLGKDASLENLQEIRSPKILHLASHGYFMDESSEQSEVLPGGDLHRTAPSKPGDITRMPTMGIALGQANAASPSASLLTPDKISGIDLRGTDLAVLSACNTGLGKLKSGEGVRGLRASFQIAGANQVVASLWYVPDDAMSSLMDRFYGSILAGDPADTALRNAKLALKKQHSNPFYWGALNISR